MSKGVGRPPETDPDGTVITKSLVNVTIPTKLAEYLKTNGINRSKLFTRIVTMLYCREICRFCFSTKISDTLTGSKCQECETWLDFKKCVNCGADYDMREGIGININPNYNHFKQSKKIEKGCCKCVKVTKAPVAKKVKK